MKMGKEFVSVWTTGMSGNVSELWNIGRGPGYYQVIMGGKTSQVQLQTREFHCESGAAH